MKTNCSFMGKRAVLLDEHQASIFRVEDNEQVVYYAVDIGDDGMPRITTVRGDALKYVHREEDGAVNIAP